MSKNLKKGDRVFLSIECIVDDVADESDREHRINNIKLVLADFRSNAENMNRLAHPIGAIWVQEESVTKIHPVPTE